MNDFRHFKYLLAVLSFMIVLAFTFGVAIMIIFSIQRQIFFDEKRKATESEIELIAELAQDAILKYDYAMIEYFVDNWGEKHKEITELRIISPNGFMIGEYKNEEEAIIPIKFNYKHEIDGKPILSINMVRDFTNIDQKLNRRKLKIIFFALVFIIVLGYLLWSIFKKTAMTPLTKEIKERKKAEAEVEILHKRLVESSRMAGMAEMATGVLHNVSNVLNSVNVSATLINDKIHASKVSGLTKATNLISQHNGDFADFIRNDEKGCLLPAYLVKVGNQLSEEQKNNLEEISLMRKNLVHLKEIVRSQQIYAKSSGLKELVLVQELVEDAIKINEAAIKRHGVTLIRKFTDNPQLNIDKHKVIQILINLIRNAKYALDDGVNTKNELRIEVIQPDKKHIQINIIDSGVGISEEMLTRIFNHGFTTRKDGHGFGLHSAALTAKELNGSLFVHSEGLGKGAVFTLELPI